MLHSQNYEREKHEPAKDDGLKEDPPPGSYYYDDATGYEVYDSEDESDNVGDLDENHKLS